MKFEPIATYTSAWSTTSSPCLDNLINDFSVIKWSHGTRMLSELERVFICGRAVYRYSDFGDMSNIAWHVMDHDAVFKCDGGATFAITMPYETPENYFDKFYDMMARYYKMKSEYAGIKPYDSLMWCQQFSWNDTLETRILSDRYKVRANGAFAAIIATRDFIHTIPSDRFEYEWQTC